MRKPKLKQFFLGNASNNSFKKILMPGLPDNIEQYQNPLFPSKFSNSFPIAFKKVEPNAPSIIL